MNQSNIIEIVFDDSESLSIPDDIELYIDTEPYLLWRGRNYPLNVKNKIGEWTIWIKVNDDGKRRWDVTFNKFSVIGSDLTSLADAKKVAKTDYQRRSQIRFAKIEMPAIVNVDHNSKFDQGYLACLRDIARSVNRTRLIAGQEKAERKQIKRSRTS